MSDGRNNPVSPHRPRATILGWRWTSPTVEQLDR